MNFDHWRSSVSTDEPWRTFEGVRVMAISAVVSRTHSHECVNVAPTCHVSLSLTLLTYMRCPCMFAIVRIIIDQQVPSNVTQQWLTILSLGFSSSILEFDNHLLTIRSRPRTGEHPGYALSGRLPLCDRGRCIFPIRRWVTPRSDGDTAP